jgi:cytochrome c oxidase cbb3-type subunit I/II
MTTAEPHTTTLTYDDAIVRRFVFASVGWGIIGMLVGALIALQLAFSPANLPPYLTFGRLRPLHTNAVIFAFVGNMIFAGVYYSTQRLLRTPLPSRLLGRIHFWGWQAIIVAAAITLPLGFTQGKEYAELEWPIDLAIAVVWVIFAIQFFWMVARRNEKHLYVAIWFYIATIVTVALLHIVNSLAIPVGPLKSYSVFGGVQDALVQWWYGHNAVAFFLTTPVLGIMYYFLPKAAERPVFSYRLSIIHFWALVFLYIWAGPHHLLNTALPDWAQSLGMVFSLMLWAPSWGGMLNGLLTLRGAWHKLRTDPVLKFFAAGVTFYGMATLEGPLLSIKAVSGLAHYTDWIIAHVHGGGLGWNGFMAAGMFYWLVPRLFGTELRSRAAANWHFWIGTLGILLYIVSMWVAGITQGMMWRAENGDGGLLYPNFVETVLELKLLYWARLVGGLLYISGFVVMAWNLVATARQGRAVDGVVEVPARPRVLEPVAEVGWRAMVLAPPVVVSVLALGALVVVGVANPLASMTFLFVAFFLVVGALMAAHLGGDKGKPGWHRMLEGKALLLTVLSTLAVLAGGVAEIVPAVIAGDNAMKSDRARPYTALELEGRDVSLREGCYTCHSQMVRPFLWESARYGEVSDADESVYDHPFQWGSRRIGPDVARLGGKYSDLWHYQHMIDPPAVTPGSIMPAYPHLEEDRVDLAATSGKLRAMRAVGVPYDAAQIEGAPADARRQAGEIVARLHEQGGVTALADSQLVALIAYLQRLGAPPPPPAPTAATAEIATPAPGAP